MPTFGEFELFTNFYKNEIMTFVFKNRVFENKVKISCTMIRVIKMMLYDGHPSGLLVLYDISRQSLTQP